MGILGTAQGSDVNNWGSNSVIGETTRIAPVKSEKYNDPTMDYGFLVAVGMGDRPRQENRFHPTHSILEPLRRQNIDLSKLPTNASEAISIMDKGIRFYFHKIPNPVIDLHKIEPYKALANEILTTLIRTINKMPSERSYKFDLEEPVILNFSKTYYKNGKNSEFEITYPGIKDTTIHKIKTSFDDADYYLCREVNESPLESWLEASANQIAKSLFA